MIRNIGKVKCPRPFTVNGRRYVAYSSDGEIIRMDLTNGERRRICYGDEYVYIGNGRAIVRDGQKIFETEDDL